ncbi:MAG: peptidase domain-containing ABC transporter [Agriterribacter sp.]
MGSFPLYKQLDAMDCGPTCLRMVAKYYGRTISLDYLRNKSQYGKQGVSLLGLADAAESIGLKSAGAKLTIDQLINDAPLPAIIYWDQYHFVVLTPASRKNKFVIADPAKGMVTLNRETFLKYWVATTENDEAKGISLLLESTPVFKQMDFSDNAEIAQQKIGWSFLWEYIKDHKAYFFQIMLGLIIGSFIQLVFPYLTQSIVDTGINTQNIGFIQIVLTAQLMLLFSQTIVEFIRSRILLHISTRINISLLSGFWSKLLKLPIQFFDSKHPGDIIQRIGDHSRIENFLTGTALNTFFSLFTLVIFSFVLLGYSTLVFSVFITGSVLYIVWIQFFLKYRRTLDYKRFAIASRENNATMQLVYGMQEIKLNNAENTYRWQWQGLQAALFKLNFKNLSLSQYQQTGAFFINQGKNIIITFIVAKLVLNGQITLGAMLAIQYIIGQLNGPVEQLTGFTQQAQDARISLERLNDIHVLADEEPAHQQFSHSLPEDQDITIKNLSFAYPGAGNEPVLKNVNTFIPHGKITAIVGMSGSGKSTLIKLLLRFYESYKGDIYLGAANFKTISPKYWRSLCGTVMQDNFIFNDNIQKNITVTNDKVDSKRLMHACKTANILPFIESLPLGFYTKLGAEGTGISGGQKQRLSIARAVYKDPGFIFFDEATNALDANNEKIILENLNAFFKGKTVVIVAHRLSTVKNADKIIVLDKGAITEEGTHEALVLTKGKYFELVKNQLELGN